MLNDNNIRLGWSSTGRGSNLPLGQTPHGESILYICFFEFRGREAGREIEGWREVEAAGLVALMATKL
jgi:hypothetical protein